MVDLTINQASNFQLLQWKNQPKPRKNRPLALDLFSGTKSFARSLELMGYDVVTLDKEMKWQPDICVDVLLWEFHLLQQGQFQVIFASPPCTAYSQALMTRLRDLKTADSLVWHTLKIIWYFLPRQVVFGESKGREVTPAHGRQMWIFVNFVTADIRNQPEFGEE